MKSIKMLLILIAGLSISELTHAQTIDLTLKDALKYALENNTNVRKARLDIEGGKYKTQEIRALALPNITGNASITDNLILQSMVLPGEFVGRPGETIVQQIGTKYTAGAGVQLNQTLFNQTVFTGLQAAKASEKYYTLNADLSDEQLIEQVANLYYQVLVTRQQLTVVDTNIKNIKVVERIISNQYQNGLAKKIDVDRIKVNLTNLSTQREQISNQVLLLENQLKFVMGMPIETEINLPKTQLSGNSINTASLYESADILNRTEMKLLNVQKDLYGLDRKAKISEYYPSLALTGSYNYNGVSDKFDFFKRSSNSTANWFDMSAIGLTLRVPIFDGFATRSKVRQADITLKKVEEDIRQAKQSLNMAHENAKIQLKDNLATITSQEKNVKLAQEIYESTQNNYNNGLASLTDLLDTENSLTQAQNSYNQALLNYKVAEIQLIKSKGELKSLIND